mgnify:FL=1
MKKKILLFIIALLTLNISVNAQLDNTYGVQLMSIGPDASAVRDALLDLDFSKSAILQILEAVPTAVAQGQSYETAYNVWKSLATAGATVAITNNSKVLNRKWGVYLKTVPESTTSLISFMTTELGLPSVLARAFVTLAPHVFITFDYDKVTDAQDLTDKLNSVEGVLAICLQEVDKFVGTSNFNNSSFLKCVQPFDLDKNGMLDDEERAAVTELNIPEKSITNLAGIELFGNLRTLDCSGNNLTKIDLSNNGSLTTVYCYNNPVTGDEVDNFIANLPEVEGGELYAYDASIEDAGINLTQEQAEAAKAKGWDSFYRESSDGEWLSYIKEYTSLYLESYPDDQKLAVVKIVKDVLGLGLKEAKDLVDAIPCYLIQDGDPAIVQSLAEQLEAIGCVVTYTGPDAPIVGDAYEVVLDDPGSAKLAIIKIIRNYDSSLTLVEAKSLVDYYPSVVLTGVTEEVANNLVNEIVEAGGQAHVKGIEIFYNVYLADNANSKIAVIKAIRDVLELGLKESKDLADSAPASIYETKDKEKAIQLRDAILAAGEGVKAHILTSNNFGLRVRGALVSNDNKDNLCDGKISFDPATLTLSLNDNISTDGYIVHNINLDGLTIKFDNDVLISQSSNVQSFVLEDNTNITGDGVLTLTASSTATMIGVSGSSKLTLDHAIMNVVGTGEIAINGNTASTLDINGGTLFTKGAVTGFGGGLNLNESQLYYPMTGIISDGSVMIGTALVDTMVITPTQYKLNLLQIPVTGQNAQDIFGKSKKMYDPAKNEFITYTPAATGLASYDASNNVLSLNNVRGTIDEYSGFGMYNYIPDMTIKVVGSNSLVSEQWTGIYNHSDAGGLTISGNGSLYLKSATWAISMNGQTDHNLTVNGGVHLLLDGKRTGLDGGVRETRTGQILSYHTTLNVETDTTVVSMKGGENAARNLKGMVLNDGLAITKPEGASFGNYTIQDAEGNPYADTWVVISKRSEEPEHIVGDVNEDSEVNINDVVAIINQMAGTATWKYANVNGDPDGNVDINDVVAVINIMAGK